MEKNTSKKLLAGVFALSFAFILASCDSIQSLPTNYDNPIAYELDENGNQVALKDGNGNVLDDNIMGKIYDNIAGDRNSTVVSDLLEKLAEEKFGSYASIVEASQDNAKMKEFIAAHKEVFVREGDDKVEGKTAEEVQEHRFNEFYKDIKNRISEVFYNEIVSGSYNDDEGRFDEEKLYMAHYYEFYDIKAPTQENKFYITSEFKKEYALDSLMGNYSCPKEEGRGYIEEKVFPQILKDKLVEEYVYNTNYGALGRAYARKVNYVKVTFDSYIMPWKLFKNFGEEYVENAGENVLDFEIIADAIKGMHGIGNFSVASGDGVLKLDENSDAYKLLEMTLGEDAETVEVTEPYMLDNVELIPAGIYFKETKLGEIIDSYQKALEAEEQGRFATAKAQAELDKFTAEGKSKEYGLRRKLIDLAKEDYTTDGWFVKNGGLSDLPSALKDRLFNINVANTLDDGSLVLETKENGNMGKYKTGKKAPYLRNIYGRKLLMPAKAQPYEDNKYSYIYHDVSGKALYIVQVLEAPSTAKLNLESSSSYSVLEETKADIFKTEDIARSVSKVLGTKDSYIKDAYTSYLEKYVFNFYESSLYEHFKSEYPDLFDDED